MCICQFILILLYFIIENLLTIVTFILSLSLCYYRPRWKPYTRLENIINSNNPLQNNKSKKRISQKSVAVPLATAPTNDEDDDEEDEDDSKGYDIRYAQDTENETKQAEDSSMTKYKQIKVLTQNLWVHYLAPSPTKRVRLEAFISFLKQKHNNYDILIIQEIFGLRLGCFIRCNDLEFLVTELFKIGYIHHTKPSGNLPYFGQNGGIALFSKYPFIYDDVFRFERSDEIMLRKGFAIGITKIPLSGDDHDDKTKYHYLCIGTGHCDPYRPNVILSQIKQFSTQIKYQYDIYKKKVNNKIDIIVGGDFNTRNKVLTQGLRDYFEDIISMYNTWTLVTSDREQWNKELVTYRNAYLPKYRVWLSILSCGLCKLPSLREVQGKYLKGYCLDHIMTNIDKSRIENVSVVDSRYKDVFVSDHMGVELMIKIPVH